MDSAGWVLSRSHASRFCLCSCSSDPEGRFIRSLTPPHSTIVVWGWHPKTFLDSGFPPATRDLQMHYFFEGGDYITAYYRRRFLSDLERRPADLFVDATDVSCCSLDGRDRKGFETIPEISSYIHAHYVQVAAKYGEQYYLRRDLLPPPK